MTHNDSADFERLKWGIGELWFMICDELDEGSDARNLLLALLQTARATESHKRIPRENLDRKRAKQMIRWKAEDEAKP